MIYRRFQIKSNNITLFPSIPVFNLKCGVPHHGFFLNYISVELLDKLFISRLSLKIVINYFCILVTINT